MSRVITVAGLTDVASQIVSDSLALDLPGSVVVRHRLEHLPGGGGSFHRCLYGVGGLVEAASSESTACCVSCSAREDAVAVVGRLAAQGWQHIIVALPPTVAPGAFVTGLAEEIAAGRCTATLAAVVGAVEAATLAKDLLEEDLLRERGWALGEGDRRSVGEALSAIIDYADIVATPDLPAGQDLELIQHCASPSSRLWLGLGAFEALAAAATDHDLSLAERRLDPVTVESRHAGESGGVWTIELASTRPFHPRRLLDQIELLGGGRIRARGCFWLPSRPHQVCGWSGAGGQLYIGVAGQWGDLPPRTRLLITGVDEEDRHRVARAFADCLLTQHEAAQTCWPAIDGLEPWLG